VIGIHLSEFATLTLSSLIEYLSGFATLTLNSLIEYVIDESYFSIGTKQTSQQYRKSNNTAQEKKGYFDSKLTGLNYWS